jgi:hypothetical protein
MQVNAEPETVSFFAEETNVIGNDQLAVERHAGSQPLQRRVGWPLFGQDVILLCQPEARMHDAIGDFTVVRQQQQTFGSAVEPSHRVDALLDLDEIKHRPPISLVVGGGDVTAWFVEEDIARLLAADRRPVNADR